MAENFEYRMTTEVNFGKHKGKSIAYLLDNEPDYLAWLYKQWTENPNPNYPKSFSTEVQNLLNFKTGGKVPAAAAAPASGIAPLSDDEVPF